MKRIVIVLSSLLMIGVTLFVFTVSTARAQVNPAEIVNPELKRLETDHFAQLMTVYREIGALKFPYTFLLSRYVGLDPDKQSEADSRGLEFVRFHERTVLKTTGNYNAAYNAELLTRNQRAANTLLDVILPVVRVLAKEIPRDIPCDGIGFEIAHHVRSRIKNADYEGKEILVVVFDRDDAFAFSSAGTAQAQQEVLNRSEIYVNGEEFGLALGAKDPLDLEALNRPGKQASDSGAKPPAAHSESLTNGAGSGSAPGSTSRLNLSLQGQPHNPSSPSVAPGQPATITPEPSPATSADAERLQAKYQSELDALAAKGVDGLKFVEYAPPSLAVAQKHVALQVTLRNPLHFEKESSSIYRRAAQSFDLFLALHLKSLLDQIPKDDEIAAVDVTLLNQVSAAPKPISEALEFVFPRKLLLQFVNDEITNQELIDRSTVLVNGVRIALNLQLVE
jgi:hypothetical protein